MYTIFVVRLLQATHLRSCPIGSLLTLLVQLLPYRINRDKFCCNSTPTNPVLTRNPVLSRATLPSSHAKRHAASLTVGNILPLGSMPEGTVCSSIEAKIGDRGTFARCSGDYSVIISHDEDKGTSKVCAV